MLGKARRTGHDETNSVAAGMEIQSQFRTK